MISQYDINHNVSIAVKECSKTDLISVCFRRRACIAGSKVRHRTLSVFAEPMPKQGKSGKRGSLKHPSVLGNSDRDVRHSGESLIGLNSALGLITKLPRHSPLITKFVLPLNTKTRAPTVGGHVPYPLPSPGTAFQGKEIPKIRIDEGYLHGLDHSTFPTCGFLL